MDAAFLGVIIPSALAFAGVGLTALVSRRRNNADGQFQFLAVLQAERVTADARADKAESRLEREASHRRRAQAVAWRYHQQLLRAGIEPDPVWPTEENEKVTA